MHRLSAATVALVSLAALLAPRAVQAQRTAALMPQVNRPAGFTEAQVEGLREAVTAALRESSYRVLARREVASRLASGPRCPPPGPCLGPAHDAIGVDLVVHLSVQGSPASTRVVVQITDGAQRIQHRVAAPATRLRARVYETVLQAARRVQLNRR